VITVINFPKQAHPDYDERSEELARQTLDTSFCTAEKDSTH